MSLEQHQRIELHETLTNRFNEGELRTFCFNLNIDYDDLPGEGKVNKARELVDYFYRRNQLSKLIAAIQQYRPDIHSEETQELASSIKMMINQSKWSVSSIVSVIAGGIITSLWMIKNPGFEPLLAIVLGLAAAGSLEKLKLPVKLDSALAVIISIVSIVGIIYLSLPSSENHAPTIHNLVTNREVVLSGEKVMIIVDATDEDDDPLSYVWSANRGIVPGGNQGPKIEYIAPENSGTGLDTIEVTVTDGKGGSIAQKITIAIENRD